MDNIRRSLVVLPVLALAIALTGCGDDSSDAIVPAEVLAEGGSVANVTIGDVGYDFVVDCYDAGAGSVVVVGAGEEPVAALPTEGDEPRDTHIFVQAFLGDSYIGVTVTEGDDEPEVVYEASLDDALDLVLEDDVIAADSFTFVRDLDLANGSSTPAGEGTLRVTCGRYEAGSAPGQGA